MKPLIITAALTGAEVSKDYQPALPTTPEDIAQAAAECVAAGAAIVHLHARLPDGGSTQSAQAYREIIDAVRARCDVIIQVSTGGAVGMSAQERIGPVTLRPEMATLSLGSVNFGSGVFVNAPHDIDTFALAMQQHGVLPELEIFDAGMMATAQRLIKQGLVRATPHFDFVLGVPGAMPATPEALMYLRSQLAPGATWSVAGMGASQVTLGALAVALGGHVRVGFEDNIYYRKGELASSNAQLVARMASIGRLLERESASPRQARAMLGLPSR
jgi:3-keto-5-aminohexanoate cleavage enzyme